MNYDEIAKESKRIAKWLNKQDQNYYEDFISHLLMESNLNYFEILGLLEHVKLEIIKGVYETVEEEED